MEMCSHPWPLLPVNTIGVRTIGLRTLRHLQLALLGALLRVHMVTAEDRSASAAWTVLKEIESMPGHEFWNDGFSYTDVPHRFLQGPKQATDACLVQLARKRSGRLATLDGSLAALHQEFALLLPM
ncbi:MAG: ribonuclease [Verrucomicrobiales bacterium]|jgi:predicted nucleic acid-binding protein|nr:ribonuclease [Verrucomicrobiales bacterium]